MAPSRVSGGMAHSSSSSGIFFQGDAQSQTGGNSHLGSSFGNSSNSIPGNTHSNIGTVLNSVPTSGPSIGASSLVTDANSGLSGGGPHLQRSASINTESYMRLPASPMSFSSVMDASSIVQKCSSQDPNSSHYQGASSSATSIPSSRMGQISLPSSPKRLGSFCQDPNNFSQLLKKPRLDIKQEDILQRQVLQQLLQRQDSMQIQSQNPQLQALIQQQRLRQQQQLLQSMSPLQQQQILQSMPPVQRAFLLQQQQQQQQLQLRQQFQQQGMQQPVSSMKRPCDSGVCSRRLMQYLYHQRQRPPDNSIAYWRKFVAEYYSPRARQRWCLSLYGNIGHHSLGVFPQAAMDVWQCDICGSKSGRGFEATFEVLPRLNEINFSSGVIDELLFLDLPRECRFPSGIMMLEYGKAVQESVYEQIRVVREGQLRIIFTPDLKILSWEFCARRHEELLPRRLVAPQVNQLLQIAQKCVSTIESGSDGISQQDLQTNSNMVVTAGRQLMKSLELHSLNDLGFSKRYVRSLQISEVVGSMKDLMDFCKQQKVGPIEGLKKFPRHDITTAKIQLQKMQEMEQLTGIHGQLNSNNNNTNTIGQVPFVGSPQNHHLLTRQNFMNPNQNPSPSSSSFQGQAAKLAEALQNPNANLLQQQGNGLLAQRIDPKGNPVLQQQQMMSQQCLGSFNGSGVSVGAETTRSNSFKATANSESSAAGGNTGFSKKACDDMTHDLQLSEEMVEDITKEFTDNGFFDGDLDDTLSYGWKD